MSECTTKVVDGDLAKHLRETANFSLQRPMSESNTLRLEAEMRAGRFVQGTPIYFGVLPNKSLLALNGNHTLDAIARCGRPIELTFIYQDVEDEAEAAAIYSRLDLHKQRSWRDALRAYNAETMLADSTVWTSRFAAALGFMFERFRVARDDKEREVARIQALRSRDIRLQAMEDAFTAADQYVKAVSCGPKTALKIFRRAPVMAVALETFRYRAAQAHEFWSTIAADDGLRAGQPQKALLRYLTEHPALGAVGRENQAKAVAIAWNAFIKGKSLDTIKPASMTVFRIEGTPWTDKDFDPLRAYLKDLFAERPAEELPLGEPDTIRTGRKIQTGMTHDRERVTIFDREPELMPAK